MKNRWLIILVILFAVIVIGLFILLIFLPKPTPVSPLSTNPFADAVVTGSADQVDSPATFSVNFYKWYIGNRQADSEFPSATQLTTSFAQWMTPSFILKYQSEIGDVNIDEDPILYAQDDPIGWGPGMTGTILTQTDTASSVQVVIGSGSLAHTYIVQLVKSNGQWLINSISSS